MTTLLIRPNRNEVDQEALATEGIDSMVDPYLRISPVRNPKGATRLVSALQSPQLTWLILSSANAFEYWFDQTPPGVLDTVLATSTTVRYAAIGEHTASLLYQRGIRNVLVPSLKNAQSLASLLAQTQPCPVVIPSGSIAMRSIPDALVPAGFTILEEVFYHTEPVVPPPPSAGRLQELGIDTVLLRSPSAVRAFIAANPDREPGVALVCGGATTARRLRELGVKPDLVCGDPSPRAVAASIAQFRRKR